MADLIIRSTALATVIDRLVCQTSLKNFGRLRSAESRCLKVKGVVLGVVAFLFLKSSLQIAICNIIQLEGLYG